MKSNIIETHETEGFASVGILSLTEKLAEANCKLERYSQWQEHLQEEGEDLSEQLKQAELHVAKTRQYRDYILIQLQQRIQTAQETSNHVLNA